ncbi:hypothetical protein BJ742DRAFT_389106 [Cladochytrium replicatum]|nr:hypothetical protein BJ742DRAFT_389106 [Cladochytrium replicatum]
MSSLLLLQLSVGFATTSFVITTGTLIARFAVPVLRPQPIVREWLVTSMLFAGLISATNSTVFGFYDLLLRGGALSPQGSFICSVSGS